MRKHPAEMGCIFEALRAMAAFNLASKMAAKLLLQVS
jgi:hypothetical protein